MGPWIPIRDPSLTQTPMLIFHFQWRLDVDVDFPNGLYYRSNPLRRIEMAGLIVGLGAVIIRSRAQALTLAVTLNNNPYLGPLIQYARIECAHPRLDDIFQRCTPSSKDATL